MSSDCGPRSRRTRSIRRSSSRSAASDTRPVLADPGMERSAVTPDAAGQPSTPAEPRDSSTERELNTLRELAMPNELTVARVPGGQREQGAQREQGGAQREYRREAWEMALRRNKAVRWLVSWLPHRVTIAVRTLLRWEHSVIAKIRQRWRRSLQL